MSSTSSPQVKTTARELEIAKQLVESLAGDFEPDKYRDTYREQVLDMIERKAQGEEISVQPPPEELTAPAPDLMSALKASLEAVREREGQGDGAAKRRKASPTKASGKARGAGGKAKATGASSKAASANGDGKGRPSKAKAKAARAPAKR